MSDYLTDLRSDLVDAHARYGQRGRAGRLARPVHPRTWRPAPMFAALAAAACVVAAVLAIRNALPEPAPAGLSAVEKVHVGGQPTDAALGFGYLWVADFGGAVIQVNPALHRVVRRVPLPGDADSIATGGGAVWVTVGERQGERRDVECLVRIDPRTGETHLSSLATGNAMVAADRSAIWVMSTDQHAWLKRIDPATGRAIATVRMQTAGADVAIAGQSLWTLSNIGVLLQRDPVSGRPLGRLPGLVTSLTSGERVLAADASGVWVLQPSGVVRVTGGSVVRRSPLVRIGTIPLIGEDGRSLWLAGSSSPLGPRARYRVFRFDRDTGALTGTLDVGFGAPRAFVPSHDGMWVLTGDGTARLVR